MRLLQKVSCRTSFDGLIHTTGVEPDDIHPVDLNLLGDPKKFQVSAYVLGQKLGRLDLLSGNRRIHRWDTFSKMPRSTFKDK